MTKRAATLSLIAALGMVGLAQTAMADAPQADPVVFLQLNEFSDCYVLNVRTSDKLAYGDIPVYPAIFTGAYGEGRATLGWTVDGGSTALLTVFKSGFTEELWQYVPGSGFSMVGTATWSFAASCSAVKSQRPRPVP